MQFNFSSLYSIVQKYGTNLFANIFQQGLRFVILYTAAKVLGPKEFGDFNLILIVASYLMNANLGAVNGMKRQIPLSYLKSGTGPARDAFFSVLNFNWIASVIISFTAAIILVCVYNYDLISGLLLIIVSFSINTYFNIQSYLTAIGNWKGLFKLQLLCSLYLLIPLLSLVFANSMVLYIAYALPFLIAGVLFFREHGYKREINVQLVKKNIAVGFPIMISGFIFLFFQTTDRLIVSRFYLGTEFGYYSFAWTVIMALNLLANLSSEIILQRASVFFSKVPDRSKLFVFLFKYSMLLQLALVVASVFLVMISVYAIPKYFADYSAAIPVLCNITIAYLVQQLALTAANYYYVVGRQGMYNILLALSCLFNGAILLAPLVGHSVQPGIGYISELYIWSSCIYVLTMYCPFLIRIFGRGFKFR